jgi:hypothetical protein
MASASTYAPLIASKSPRHPSTSPACLIVCAAARPSDYRQSMVRFAPNGMFAGPFVIRCIRLFVSNRFLVRLWVWIPA